jgi:Rod binding domain-containing protein
MVMGVAEIQIAQVNRERENRAQHADGIVPINSEINEQEDRTESAAFPESDRDNTLSRALGRNPLNDETSAEDNVARPAKNFPGIDSHAECGRLREKMKMLHGANVREEPAQERVFSSGNKFA